MRNISSLAYRLVPPPIAWLARATIAWSIVVLLVYVVSALVASTGDLSHEVLRLAPFRWEEAGSATG